MRRSLYVMMLAASVAAGCSRQTPEQRTINDAATALGGRDRILAIKSLVIEGIGTQGNLGQDMTPESSITSFFMKEYKRSVDVAGGRARTELTRVPNFRYFAGQAAQKQIAGVDGTVAYNVAADGTASRAADRVASDRRAEFYHHPVTAVRGALQEGAALTNPRTENGENLIDVKTADGAAFTLVTDAANLPVRVISTTDNPNLGDVVVQTTFANYQDVNGLKLPARLTTNTDALMTLDIRVNTQTVDAEVGDLAAPAAAAAAAAITGPGPVNVTAEQLAPGIWFLGGQSHNSVLVEFNDHLTLIEAPQNDPRALAVIAKARELVPSKPLTQVVMSHHHFDHSGGIRAAISEGLTVIAHKNAAPFVEAASKRPHTIVPDALARNPKPATVEAVDGQRTLTDGRMTVNLYAIQDSNHSDTMLVAHFPRERILVEADLYSPAAQVAPFVENLFENLTAQKLNIARVAPLHGRVVPYAELVKTVQAQAYENQPINLNTTN